MKKCRCIFPIREITPDGCVGCFIEYCKGQWDALFIGIGISFSSNEYACRDEYRNSKLYRITFGEYDGLPCGLRNVNDLTSSNISLGGS